MIGILGYSLTQNIGDDIQSLAMMQLFPEFEVFVDRDMTEVVYDRYTGEKINLYSVNKKIITIFNCYFSEPRNYWVNDKIKIYSDIDENIDPIFLGLYTCDGLPIEQYKDTFKNSYEIYGPISCRSTSTANKINKLLKSNINTQISDNDQNIFAYFLGCPSILLEPPSNIIKTDVILCVDVAINCVKNILISNGEDINNKNFINITVIYPNLVNMSVIDRFNLARKQLHLYASAYKVFTTRLHCYLPCKAMNVDVMFIKNEFNIYDDRLSDFISLNNSQIIDIKNNIMNQVHKIRNKLNLSKIDKYLFRTMWNENYYFSRNISSKTISIHLLIATIGRKNLIFQLDSIRSQMLPSDIVTIVFDNKDIDNVFETVKSSVIPNWPCAINLIMEQNNLGYWGHGIRNKYRDILYPRDIVLHADDDDIYSPNGITIVREYCGQCTDISKELFIFQMVTSGNIVWSDKVIRLGNIGTPCGAIPFNINKICYWKLEYGGDSSFYIECSKLVDKVNFIPEIIYIVRPGII